MDTDELRTRARKLGLPEDADPVDVVRAIQESEGNEACFRSGRNWCAETSCCWMSECLPDEYEQLAESAGVGARTGPWRR